MSKRFLKLAPTLRTEQSLIDVEAVYHDFGLPSDSEKWGMNNLAAIASGGNAKTWLTAFKVMSLVVAFLEYFALSVVADSLKKGLSECKKATTKDTLNALEAALTFPEALAEGVAKVAKYADASVREGSAALFAQMTKKANNMSKYVQSNPDVDWPCAAAVLQADLVISIGQTSAAMLEQFPDTSVVGEDRTGLRMLCELVGLLDMEAKRIQNWPAIGDRGLKLHADAIRAEFQTSMEQGLRASLTDAARKCLAEDLE